MQRARNGARRTAAPTGPSPALMLKLKARHNLLDPLTADTVRANQRWTEVREASDWRAHAARSDFLGHRPEESEPKRPRHPTCDVESEAHRLRTTSEMPRCRVCAWIIGTRSPASVKPDICTDCYQAAIPFLGADMWPNREELVAPTDTGRAGSKAPRSCGSSACWRVREYCHGIH